MYTADHLYYEDLEVGQSWESPPREMTFEMILAFADLTGDHNPMHVNPEYAATTPFGRPIAHGLLCLGIAGGLAIGYPPIRTIAVLELISNRFTAAVYPGDILRVHCTVLAKERRGRGRRGQVTWQRTLVNQDGKTVQEGKSVTLVEAREPVRD